MHARKNHTLACSDFEEWHVILHGVAIRLANKSFPTKYIPQSKSKTSNTSNNNDKAKGYEHEKDAGYGSENGE